MNNVICEEEGDGATDLQLKTSLTCVKLALKRSQTDRTFASNPHFTDGSHSPQCHNDAYLK